MSACGPVQTAFDHLSRAMEALGGKHRGEGKGARREFLTSTTMTGKREKRACGDANVDGAAKAGALVRGAGQCHGETLSTGWQGGRDATVTPSR